MRLYSLVATTALLSASLAAHADTVFNLAGTFSNGASLSGTITLNSGSTSFDAVNAIISGGGGPTVDFTSISAQGQQSSFYDLSLYSGTAYLFPDFATTSLAGYGGSLICSSSSPCGGVETIAGYSNASPLSLTTGAVTPQTTSVTPEPSTIALLGTGLLGVAGVVRKRFA